MTEDPYVRLRESPGVGGAALDLVQGSTVGVVGLGNLEGQALPHLSMLGVGMCLVDSGRVEPPNLGNQGFSVGSLGKWKTQARARQIRAINPDVELRLLTGRIEDLGLAALAGCDLVITGLDSFFSRFHVNELCQQLGIPWIDAALDGSGQRPFGRIMAFDPRKPESACFACRFDEATLDAIWRESATSPCPSWRRTASPASEPTLQTSALAAIIAGFQTLWALRFLVGRGDDLLNQGLLIDCAPRPRVERVSVERNPRCVHHALRLEPLRPASGDTVGELVREARAEFGCEPDELRLHRRRLVKGLRCPECGAVREIVRLNHAFSDAEVHCSCRHGAEMSPIATAERLWSEETNALAGVRWAEMGVPARDVVTAVSGDREMHFIVRGCGTPTCPQSAGGEA